MGLYEINPEHLIRDYFKELATDIAQDLWQVKDYDGRILDSAIANCVVKECSDDYELIIGWAKKFVQEFEIAAWFWGDSDDAIHTCTDKEIVAAQFVNKSHLNFACKLLKQHWYHWLEYYQDDVTVSLRGIANIMDDKDLPFDICLLAAEIIVWADGVNLKKTGSSPYKLPKFSEGYARDFVCTAKRRVGLCQQTKKC
jgi:hypothetical protein